MRNSLSDQNLISTNLALAPKVISPQLYIFPKIAPLYVKMLKMMQIVLSTLHIQSLYMLQGSIRSRAMLTLRLKEIHKSDWLPAQGEDLTVPSPAASSLSQTALHVAA